MGQEILYCFQCQVRLMGSDFERGKAFRIDGKAVCPDCARGLLAHLPDPDAELERLKRTQVPKSGGVSTSSTRIPSVQSTARIPLPPARPGGAEPPAPSRGRLIAAAVGGLALLVLLAVVFSRPKEPRPAPVAIPDPQPPEPRPDPVNPIARDLEELDARVAPLLRQERVQEAAALLAAARGKSGAPEWSRGVDERFRKLEPVARRAASPILDQVGIATRKGDPAALKDLRSRIDSFGVPALSADFDAAVAAAKSDPWIVLDLQSPASQAGATLTKQGDGSILASGGTPPLDTYTASAQVGLKRVRAIRIEALPHESLPAGGPGRAGHGNFVLSDVKVRQAGTPLAFAGASATFEQEDHPSSAAIDGHPLTGWAVAGRFGQASAAVFHLQSPSDLESVTFVLEQRTHHREHLLGCFRISVSVLELPPPPPSRPANVYVPKPDPPKVDVPPASVLAYRSKWTAAARLAAARDLAGTVKVLEEARSELTDEVLRKEADADIADFRLAADALAEAPRLLPRWTKGAKVVLEFLGDGGSTERLDGTILEASARGVSLQSDGGELDVPAGELAAGSVAALTALRGEKKATDARAAAVLAALEGRAGPDLPARFAEIRAALDPREAEARRLFWAAEEDYASMKTRGPAGAVYEKLLQDPTAFSTRNKAFLEERVAGARELFFFADEIGGAGTFALTGGTKPEAFWMSAADSAPGKAAANYLELDVHVAPGAACKAWVYAGGCCQEVFTFFLQGTGLTGPSAKNPRETVTAPPGGEEWISARPPSLSLKKKHADHTGPKEPDRWTWVELGALKFAEAGPKKLRILTEQKGFAVAYVATSTARITPPRDGEVAQLLKNRPPAVYAPTGTILREIWRGVNGDAVSELTKQPKYLEGKPDESGLVPFIDSQSLGDAYGCRIRGYVHPPETGDYVFWVASDDQSELWLSSDDSPAKKQKIGSLSHAVAYRDWNAEPTQKSSPVPLVAGKRYYIEVFQKEGGGSDHVSVGWQLPGGAQERPIPGTRLSPVGALPIHKIARPHFRSIDPAAGVLRSPYHGGGGGRPFEHAPTPPQLLRGLKYGLSPKGCIGSLKPVYQGPSGDVDGPQFGTSAPSQVLVARPGYAVGGLVVRSTDRLNAFKLIFMRVSGTQLVATDRYESDWIGTRAGGTELRLGDDGTPVLGLYGRAGGEVDGAGLLLQGR